MKKAKIVLLALMALLAAVGLVVTFKPLMERASRQKQVDEANDSFIQQLEQIQSVKDAEPEATPYAQLREQIEQYNTWLYEGKQIALTNAAAYEQPAFILTQYGLQDETFGIIHIPKLEVTLPLYLGANDENMANGRGSAWTDKRPHRRRQYKRCDRRSSRLERLSIFSEPR